MRFFVISLIGISVVIALVPHVIYAVTRLLGTFFHFRVSYRGFGMAALALVLLWLGTAFYGHIWGRFRMEVKSLTLAFADLPKSFDGYRIVHLSDLHLDGWQGRGSRLQAMVDSVNALKPDMIVFTGDIVSLSEEELTPLVSVLNGLKARDGIFSVMGNHDYLPYTRSWTERERAAHVERLKAMERDSLGWRLLLNENALLHRGGDSIAVLGSENQSCGIHAIVRRGDLARAAAGTDGLFRILLTHDPTHWRAEVLPETDIQLTLSGHTHGGQMSLFRLFYVSAFIYKEHAGLYSEGGQYLYVSTGIGGTMPMRVAAPAEIALLTLRRE